MQAHLKLLLSISLLGSALSAPAADFFVSPSGDNTNPGSLIAPWRTIQHAASTVPPGSTVFLRGGLYSEKVVIEVSGNAIDGPVVFKAHPGEEPVIDGTGLAFDPGSSNALLTIIDRSYLRIEGLTLRNLKTAKRHLVPVGVLIEGNSHHIELVGNIIHNIETRYNGPDGGDGHGIGVFGTETDPIHDLVIAENELFDLKLGSSEALVLNGNVSGFEVRDNVVRDCNNIGIDFIGYEGTGPNPTVDRARDGICRGNLVFGIDSTLNPAYGGHFTKGGGDTSAGGIYVDGGARILVEGNVVFHCNIGIELASEHAGRSTEEITVRNNLLYHNTIGGLFLGGYDTRRGSTIECSVFNNTLFENDTRKDGNGEIHLQFDVRDCVFSNNLLRTNGQGLLMGNPYTQNSGNEVNHQLYFAPNGAQEWQWKKRFHTGFGAYRTASGNDADSFLSEPAFADASRHDFRLMSVSPSRNTGDAAFVPAPGETDLIGTTRIGEGRVDHGAFEYRATAPDADLTTTGDGTDFGEVVWRGGIPVERDFLVTNSGTEALRPVYFAFEGPGSSAFRFFRTFAVLPAGESRTVRVRFAPGKSGDFSSQIVIHVAFTDGNEIRLALSGAGIAPDQLPDEQAGLSPRKLRGNGVYNTSSSGQTVSLGLKRRSGHAWFRSENDGALHDTLRITGTRGNRFLTITYFRKRNGNRGNVTATLVTGRNRLSLPSGAGQNDECRFSKTPRGLSRRFQRSVSTTVLSTTLPSARDRSVVRVAVR